MHWKDFFFGSPYPIEEKVGLYDFQYSEYHLNPAIGVGAQGYAFQWFQTLPIQNMLNGNGRIPLNYFKPLGQNNLVALRPAGPPHDIAQIPVGETNLFPELLEA
jgi:hypothetical protein